MALGHASHATGCPFQSKDLEKRPSTLALDLQLATRNPQPLAFGSNGSNGSNGSYGYYGFTFTLDPAAALSFMLFHVSVSSSEK